VDAAFYIHRDLARRVGKARPDLHLEAHQRASKFGVRFKLQASSFKLQAYGCA
jgi:hypothetical protein